MLLLRTLPPIIGAAESLAYFYQEERHKKGKHNFCLVFKSLHVLKCDLADLALHNRCENQFFFLQIFIYFDKLKIKKILSLNIWYKMFDKC